MKEGLAETYLPLIMKLITTDPRFKEEFLRNPKRVIKELLEKEKEKEEEKEEVELPEEDIDWCVINYQAQWNMKIDNADAWGSLVIYKREEGQPDERIYEIHFDDLNEFSAVMAFLRSMGERSVEFRLQSGRKSLRCGKELWNI